MRKKLHFTVCRY